MRKPSPASTMAIDSQKTAESLDTTLQDAIIIMDAKGGISFWNPVAEILFGYSPQEAEGKTLDGLLAPPDYRSVYRKAFSQFQKKEPAKTGGTTLRLQARRKDGCTLPIKLSLSTIRISDTWHTVSIIGDISRRKHAGDALRESEKKISSILNAIEDVVMSYSLKDDCFLYLSPCIERIFGRTIEEFRQNRYLMAESVHPDDSQILYEITERLSDAGAAEGEYRIVRPDGSSIWVHARAKVILDDNGEPDRIDRVITDISERKDLELQLRRNKEELSEILDAIDDVVISGTLEDNHCNYLSPSYEKLFANNKDQALHKLHPWAEFVHPDDVNIVYDHIMQLSENAVAEHAFRIITAQGNVTWLRSRSKIIAGENGAPEKVLRVLTDISKDKESELNQKKLQKQILQAKKMESVSRLAGGVAHDFNNMLSVIIGNADLALRNLKTEHPLHDTFNQIRRAAERSAALTRQLLAFSGQQAIEPQVLDLNETVEDVLTTLRRFIDEQINLKWQPGGNLDPIKMDPSQINQVLTEVCLHARKTFDAEGTITIVTGSAFMSEADCAQHSGATPGKYITLTVKDNGRGMSSEALEQIFDPFFTINDMDKGTGLGLATVFGIIEQNNGFITITSEQGKGSCVTMYLPRCSGAAQQPLPITEHKKNAAQGPSTILLVDDELDNLELFRTMLESQGHTVLAASSPKECFHLASSYTGRIDLLVTDVVMPETNGRELADAIIAMTPSIKCLFMSGYSADVIAQHGVLNPDINFIEKPFSLRDFTSKVKNVLEAPH